MKGRTRAKLEVSDSDVNIVDDNDVDNGWTKSDDLGNLEQFLGNTGLAFTYHDPTRISEVVNRFLGNYFLEILVQQSNLYRAHVPKRNPVGRLSGDMKDHQLQVIDGVGKRKYPQMCAAHKSRKHQIYLQFMPSPSTEERLLHEVPHQDEILTSLVSSHFIMIL
jgi:hypothetical protein